MSSRRFGAWWRTIAVLSLVLTACVEPPPPAAPTDPWTAPGFHLDTVATGLTLPTAVSFTPGGKMFVAEKRGTIKGYQSVASTSPVTVIDMSAQVYQHADRGLLGLEADPQFETGRPYLYAIYSAEQPLFGDNPNTSDSCTLDANDGCVIRSELVRITVDVDTLQAVGEPLVLTDNWCHQFPSHSIADVKIGPEGALYATSGEGASFNNVDYGQLHGATLRNPCDDPPTGVGVLPTPPTAAGGALRAQSAAVPHPGFEASFDGAMIRLDPDTGAPWPTNQMVDDPDTKRASIIAYGLRNPFRMAMRPGTTEVWISDVGWDSFEEINRYDTTSPTVKNYGWPCYEGPVPQPAYKAVGLNLCQRLYDDPSLVTPPMKAYSRHDRLVADDGCPKASSVSAAGLGFYQGGSYPEKYEGGLFFSDYSRGCTWFFPLGTDGAPDFSAGEVIVRNFRSVDLEFGPGGDIFEVDHTGGKIARLTYDPNGRPVAIIQASTRKGGAPLTVQLSASRSYDPDPADVLTYAWDLDDDGEFDDGTDVEASVTYETEGVKTVRLQVMDSHGATATTSVTIEVGNQYPVAKIDTPGPGTKWSSGDLLSFTGSATDPQDGVMPASAFTWEAVLHHCANNTTNNCHLHPLEEWSGVTSGSFVAPDHEYPSYVELKLTVTDSHGNVVSVSRNFQPNTVELQVLSDPPGATVVVGQEVGPAPLKVIVIKNSPNVVLTEQHQVIGGVPHVFAGWSDGGDLLHEVALSESGTITATFVPESP